MADSTEQRVAEKARVDEHVTGSQERLDVRDEAFAEKIERLNDSIESGGSGPRA